MDKYILLLLESSISLLLFYAIYVIWLRKETFFQANRVYLLIASLLSILIPWLSISLQLRTNDVTVVSYVLDTVIVTASGFEAKAVEKISEIQWISMVYFAGAFFMTILFVINLLKINKLIKKAYRCSNSYSDVYYLESDVSHFTFLNKIYINPAGLSEEKVNNIIAHEKLHISQNHTVDCLFYELLIILFWFNPIVYKYRKSARTIHEYLADEGAIRSGVEDVEYQQLLLSQATGFKDLQLAHSFNYSLTKKRLIMLTKIKSSNWKKIRLFGFMPVLLATLLFFACNKVPTADAIVFDESGYDKTTNTYKVVDVMPEYEGGMQAFKKDLMTGVVYPAEARANSVEGKVYVQFIIDENGEVGELACLATRVPVKDENDLGEIVVVGYENAESDSDGNFELLQQEAIRVISSLQKWTPGKKSGESVRVVFTVPVSFQLQ